MGKSNQRYIFSPQDNITPLEAALCIRLVHLSFPADTGFQYRWELVKRHFIPRKSLPREIEMDKNGFTFEP